MIDHLRQRLQALQKAPGIEGRPGALTFGIPAIDTMLGGGFVRGALHEIAATGEAHLPAAAGFALAVARRAALSPRLFWVSEDMALGRKRRAARRRPRCLWPRSGAVGDGVHHASPRLAVGDGRSVALRRDHRGDRRNARRRNQRRCDTATVTRGSGKRHAGFAAADRTSRRRFDRSHALGRRCSTFDRSRHTARCRAACPQPLRPDRNVDSRME